MTEKPERYYVDETVVRVISNEYPNIPDEIRLLLGWYRPRENRFEIPPDICDTRIMNHQEVYDMLMWTRGYRSDSEAVKCNTQLLTFLRLSLGWKEEDERAYPNPHNII